MSRTSVAAHAGPFSTAIALAAFVACGGDASGPTSTAVASVEVRLDEAALLEGEVTTARATLRDAEGAALTNRTVTWSSSVTAVATVSATGSVSAVAAGSAEIRATSEGRTGSATVTVTTPVVASVVISGGTTVAVDAPLQLVATARDSRGNVVSGKAVRWDVDDATLASVSASGVVTGILPGTPTVTATVQDVTATLEVIVTAPTIARTFNGLSGHFSGGVQDYPGRVEWGWGYSFYNTVHPLKPNMDDWTQLGWGTWLSANPYEDENDAWAPRPENVCAPDAGIPTLFQSNEGGVGSWGDIRFPTAMPKYMIGATGDCYTTFLGGPAYHPGGEPLAADALYFAQLSNRLLLPPDRLNFSPPSGPALFGVGWIALPIIPAGYSPYGIPTGENSWTLFFNAANFAGPVGFFTPAMWTSLDAAGGRSAGYGLDRRSMIASSWSLEVGFTPDFSATLDGVEYRRIPRMTFAVGADGHAAFLQDVRHYSKAALWDQVASWLDGGSPVAQVSVGGTRAMTVFPVGDGLRMLDASGLVDFAGLIRGEPGTTAGGGSSFGLQWDGGAEAGVIPEYYKKVDGVWTAIPASEVPRRTWLTDQAFPQLPRGTVAPLSTGAGSPWTSVNWAAGPFSASLPDGSTVDYVWYRFVDQPAMARLGLSAEDGARVQAWVESLHEQASIALPSPSSGALVDIAPAQLVTPPGGLTVGYVPIVIAQR